MLLRRFIHLPTRWGWTSEASWEGCGKAFNISIPAQEHLIIQGVKYNPEFRELEVWGHYANKKYMDTVYNGCSKYVPADIGRPESKEGDGRR
jgi:hypothetical protein